MTRRIFSLIIISIMLVATLSGCSSAPSGAAQTELKMAPMDQMPDEVRRASVTVQQAYQFNVANPDIMQNLPCYCGCGAVGHKSNYACYVQNTQDGKITFDQHALGCSICVDITVDTMRMQREGKSLPEIRQAIDATYSKFGPSNMEP